MNTREKKRLYKKYLQKIDNVIQRSSENQEYVDGVWVDDLKELRIYVEVSGVKLFYELHEKCKWPNLKTRSLGLTKLRKNTVLSREVTLKQLEI